MPLEVLKEQKKLRHDFQKKCRCPFQRNYLQDVKDFSVGSKIVVLLLTLFSLILMNNWRQLLINLILMIVVSSICGVICPLSDRVKKFLLVCLGIVGIHAFFNPHNQHFIYFIGIEGFNYGLIVSLRLLCIITAANFFLLTTEMTELIRWFGRINSDFGTIMGLALSIIPMMQHQMTTTLEVQSARGLRRDKIIDRFFAFIAVIVPVIVKSIIRAHKMAQLLFLRGYDGRLKQEKYSIVKQDWYTVIFGLSYFLINLYYSLNI